MKRRIEFLLFLGALLSVLVACRDNQPPSVTPASLPSPTAPTTIDPQVVAWLKSEAIPFKTSRPGSGFDDLQPLKKIIGNARIVALGHATHGTHEFQEMNARLLEFLVEESGFNTWAMEVPMPEAFLVNDYVETGEGDPARLLTGLHFWIWNTQEVLDTIKWMRAHNQKPGAAKVSFYGFDVPYSRLPMENVIDYLKKVDPSAADQTNLLYRCFLRDLPRQSGDSQVLPFTQACTENLQQAYDNLLAQRATYENLSSPKEFAQALQNARIIQQIDRAYYPGGELSARDHAMAENVAWVLSQAGPDAKLVVSAHIIHVATRNPWWRSMGSFLRERYGNEMVVIGSSFYGGSVNEIELPNSQPSAHQVSPPAADSYQALFHTAGIPQFFLDLRNLESGSRAAEWMRGPHPFRFNAQFSVGNPDREYDAQLLSEFDVIMHFEETTPSILLTK